MLIDGDLVGEDVGDSGGVDSLLEPSSVNISNDSTQTDVQSKSVGWSASYHVLPAVGSRERFARRPPHLDRPGKPADQPIAEVLLHETDQRVPVWPERSVRILAHSARCGASEDSRQGQAGVQRIRGGAVPDGGRRYGD